jgi:hypothetical protein
MLYLLLTCFTSYWQHLQLDSLDSYSPQARTIWRVCAHTHTNAHTHTHTRTTFKVLMYILIWCTLRQMIEGLIVVCLTGASRIDSMTPLINKNDRDICDRIYRVKAFIIVSDISRYGGLTSLQCCGFIITSHHLRRCFVFYGGHTSKSSNVFTRFFIKSVATSSPTIHPSVYISMVHHDNIYIFSFSIGYLCVGMSHSITWCMCVCMCTHGGQSYFLYLEWKR